MRPVAGLVLYPTPETKALMKTAFAIFASLCLLTAGSIAADKPGFVPHPVTLTVYVAGMECGTCQALITQSVKEVKSVADVSVEIIGSYVNVSFDTHVSSAHQIAQAIAETQSVHGRPFVATMKMSVPDYAKDGNAAKVDAVFAKRTEWVEVELLDKAKGEFVVHFNPLTVDKSKDAPQGWNPGHFGHAVHDPAPKGLGLAFALKYEAPYAPAPKVLAGKR